MPLKKSSSDKVRSENIAAEIRAGRKPDQAAAIAYRVQRDAKAKGMARGGKVGYAPGGGIPFYMRDQARQTARPSGGIVGSAVPGRSDRIPLSPKGGSYIVPADVVSAIGQGNTAAGGRGLSRMFGMGPYGIKGGKVAMPRVPMPKMPRGRFADGGAMQGGDENVDIMAAGGEFVIPAEKVAEVGNGDMDRGHAILDDFVMQARKKAIKTLKGLPGPRQK